MSATAPIDHRKSARRGPEPLPVAELRTNTVSVRLNAFELAALDAQRAPVHMQRGEYLRCAALHRLPPTIPSVNRLAWVDLARASANLNQISRRQAEAERGAPDAPPSAEEVGRELADFRRALISANPIRGVPDEI